MKVEVKRIGIIDTDTGFAVQEIAGETATVLLASDVIKPDTKGKSLKEQAEVFTEALDFAKRQALSFLWSDQFKKYNEMVGFEQFTPQVVSETEFAVFEEIATEEV